MDSLQTLSDRAEITETLLRYGFGMDTKDRALTLSAFAVTVETDYSDATGVPAATLPAEQLPTLLPAFGPPDIKTQHTFSNIAVALEGDRATARVYYQAMHRRPQGAFDVYGWYEDTLTRTLDGWRISAIKIRVNWTSGDPAVLAL